MFIQEKICIQCILHPTLKLFKTVEKKTISSLKHVYYFLIKLELKINFNL